MIINLNKIKRISKWMGNNHWEAIYLGGIPWGKYKMSIPNRTISDKISDKISKCNFSYFW